MRRFILFICFLSFYSTTFTQNIDSLINEGIDLHDRGYYEQAIDKYDSVLAIDKNHYLANYEKSYTLFELKQYEKSIEISKLLLKQYKKDKDNSAVYINYGTCLDYLNKPKEAVKIYDEGIKSYPSSALLHYNKAITLFNLNEVEKAIEATKFSLINNPYHASSHNIISSVFSNNNKVYSTLATLVFLIIEPQGQRAMEKLKQLEKVMNGSAKKTGDNTISIDLNLTSFTKKKKTQDDFSTVEMMMGLTQALNFDEKYKDETPQERISRNLSSIINSITVGKDDGKGFSWDFYTPFFIELANKNYVDVLSHLIFISKDDVKNGKWLAENKEKVEEFFTWFRDYKWAQPKI